MIFADAERSEPWAQQLWMLWCPPALQWMQEQIPTQSSLYVHDSMFYNKNARLHIDLNISMLTVFLQTTLIELDSALNPPWVQSISMPASLM